MLSRSHKQEYQDFLTLLNKYRSTCTSLSSHIKQNTSEPNLKEYLDLLHQQFTALSSWFEKHILRLKASVIEQGFLLSWQSIQTEIKREFRLLTTNMLLLKSSRQVATLLTRIKTIDRNLEKLANYCQAILT